METKSLVGTGKGIFNFVAWGEAIFVDEPYNYLGLTKDKVIITKSPSPAIYLLMKDCAGVVSQNGGVVSHLAIIGMDMNVPVIVGVPNICENVSEGQKIQIVSIEGKGEVYAIE